MTYEQGFAQGEIDAYRDRKTGVPREDIGEPRNEWQRGYRDGYTPRRADWWRVCKGVTA